MSDYEIIHDNKANTCIVFLYESTRCCRASLEGAAFLNGSQVRLCSYFVICYGKYFTSELNKINKKCDYNITNIVFLLKEAARCCRASLEGAAFLSGS